MEKDIKRFVKERYAEAVLSRQSGCGCADNRGGASCCGSGADASEADVYGIQLGYSDEDLASVPEGANLNLGCGNPQAIAGMQPGEVVVDLGSGAGFDCFLAARQVGESGRVYGIDMTEEMVETARKNAEGSHISNVEFILGEIESIPLPDAAADVVISNCVINLSPEKPKVFTEAFRILKPGGRLAVSDIVTSAELPEEIKDDLLMHSACIAGASPIDEIIRMMEKAGFTAVSVEPKGGSQDFIKTWAPGSRAEDYILSADITGKKPG